MYPNLDSGITVCLEDSLLRKQDIELLQTPSWLNDSVIAFYFEYLESNIFRGNKGVLCIPPQVSSSKYSVFQTKELCFIQGYSVH